MSGISEDSIWRHPLDRKISRGQFRYDFHRGALEQIRDKGRQFYINRTDKGVFEYLGVTEAINFYFGIDYRNVSNFRAMERGTRIHSYIEQGIRDNSFEASLSNQDWEALAQLQISRTSEKRQKEDIAFLRANYERMTSEMGYANRILAHINKNYPASKGWKIHSEYLVSDFTNYASSIDILCTNEQTKEAVILDLKTGTIKHDAVNAQTGIYKHFLKNDPRYQDYTISLGAITIDKQTNKVNVLPLAGISEDQAHEILYPASSFDEKSIWYKNKDGIADFAPGYGAVSTKKETKIIHDVFSPDTMRVNPLDDKVASDLFHRVKPKDEREPNKQRKGEIGDVVSFDIETLPLSNGTMSLRSFSIFNFTAFRDGRQMKLKYSQGVDEQAFLSTEAFTNKTKDTLKQRAIDALEKNLLSDEAVRNFERMHGREARIATSQDILDLMDKLVGKTVIGHNILNFDFPQLLAMGKRLAKAEGGEVAFSAFKSRFESKLAKMSIIDTYELAKELRYKGPSFFSTITVESLIERLSPKDAAKIRDLLHQSSADVLATAKIFEVLFNTLPPEEIDFLYKIIKDTKQGKHYTVTSKFETDSKVQRVGNKKGELRAMDASAYGPVGFELNKTTHWILGEEKTIGGITYKRYDDARKYERTYNETVSNAIAKNQVILKPMDSGKGYYLTVEEEDTDTNLISYADFTKAEADLKEKLRQKGVALFHLPRISEKWKGTPGEYRRIHGNDKSPEHWAMVYDTHLLESYNRLPVFIRNIEHKRFNFMRSLFGGASALGRHLLGKESTYDLQGDIQIRRNFIKFDKLVDAYIHNLTLQNSDTVIKYKRGYWKMAGELDNLMSINESLKDALETQQEQEKETFNAGAGIIASLADVKSILDFGKVFHKYSIEELKSFQTSKAFNSLLEQRLSRKADRAFIKKSLASVIDAKITAKAEEEAKALREKDTLYTFDVLKGLSPKDKENLRPLFIQAQEQEPYLAAKTATYIQKVSTLAKSYGFKDDVSNDVLAANVSHFLMEGEAPTKEDLRNILPQLQAKADFYARIPEIEAGFAQVRQKRDRYNATKELQSNIQEKIATTDASSTRIPSWYELSPERRKHLEEVKKQREYERSFGARLSQENEETATKMLFKESMEKLKKGLGGTAESADKLTESLKGVQDGFEGLTREEKRVLGAAFHTPFYNPEKFFGTAYHQIGGLHSSLTGLIPNFMNTSITKMLTGTTQDYERSWLSTKYGLKKADTIMPVLGSILGAAVGGPNPASLAVGAMLGKGAAAITSQFMGLGREEKVEAAGLFFQSRFNKMGALLTTVTGALNLFAKALKIATVPILGGIGLGVYHYKRALANMAGFATPLTNLTGVSYGNYYQDLERTDLAYGMAKGTTNKIVEDIEFQKQGLFTLGRYDKSKLLSAAMLGVFGDAFIPNGKNGAANYSDMMNKLYNRMSNAGNSEKQRMMYLLNLYNPDMARQIQVRTDMTNFLNRQEPGSIFRKRANAFDITDDQRQEFRAITFFQNNFADSISKSLMKVAAGIYKWKGFDFMNALTGVVGKAGDYFAAGRYDEGLQEIADGIVTLMQKIGDTWKEVKDKLGVSSISDQLINKAKLIGYNLELVLLDLGDLALNTIEKIQGPVGKLGSLLMEQFSKLFEFVGTLRFEYDLDKLARGETGGITAHWGYKTSAYDSEGAFSIHSLFGYRNVEEYFWDKQAGPNKRTYASLSKIEKENAQKEFATYIATSNYLKYIKPIDESVALGFLNKGDADILKNLVTDTSPESEVNRWQIAKLFKTIDDTGFSGSLEDFLSQPLFLINGDRDLFKKWQRLFGYTSREVQPFMDLSQYIPIMTGTMDIAREGIRGLREDTTGKRDEVLIKLQTPNGEKKDALTITGKQIQLKEIVDVDYFEVAQ